MSLDTLIEAARYVEQQEIQQKRIRHSHKSPFGDDLPHSPQSTKCQSQPLATAHLAQQSSHPPPPPLLPHQHPSSATVNCLSAIPTTTSTLHHHQPHPPPAPPPSSSHKDALHLNSNSNSSNSFHIGNCSSGIHDNAISKTTIVPTSSMVLHMNGGQTSSSSSQTPFSTSISTVSTISSTTSLSSNSQMNGLSSTLSSNHNSNNNLPVTYAVESSLVAVDKDYQRRAAGTREVHNKLEKNRRAHLKECFESLKKNLPSQVDEKKASNLSILHAALTFIKSLKKTEKECEHELERLAREKISLQQRLSNLKKELTAQWEHLDLTAILPPSAPGSGINETGIIIGANSSTISDHDHEALSDDSNPPIFFSNIHSHNSNPSSSTSTQTTLTSSSQVNNSLPTSVSTSTSTTLSGHSRKSSSSPPPLVPTSAALAAAAAAAAAHQQHASKDTQTTPIPSGILKTPSNTSTQSPSPSATLAAVSLSGRHVLPVVASTPGLAATLVSPSFQLFGPSHLRVVQAAPDSNQPVALTVATAPQGGNTTGTNISSRHINNSEINHLSSQSKPIVTSSKSLTTNSTNHQHPSHQSHIALPNGLTIPTNGVISHHHHIPGPTKNSTAVQTTPADPTTAGSAVATAVLTSATGMSTHLATSGGLAHMMATHPGLTPLVTPVAVVSQGSQVAHILAGKMMSSAPLLKPMPLVSAQYLGAPTLVKPVVVVSTSSTLPSHSNA